MDANEKSSNSNIELNLKEFRKNLQDILSDKKVNKHSNSKMQIILNNLEGLLIQADSIILSVNYFFIEFKNSINSSFN